MKYQIPLSINNDIELFITGNYYKAEYENGLPDRFEIDIIKSEDDNLYELLEWTAVRKLNYITELERLCIEYINEEL
jgi:hypothetical protein